ncbi:MAG: hypothetical protein R3D85_00275 [Paracoccaceae bacterium]
MRFSPPVLQKNRKVARDRGTQLKSNDFLRIGTPRSRLNGLLPAGFPKNSLFLPKLTQPSDHRRPADQTAPHAAGQVPKNRGKIRKAAENTPCFRSLRAPRAEGDKSKDWVAEEPVWSYPVSANFPANREINRVFLLFSGNQCWDRRKSLRLFNALFGISLLTGTGNFLGPNKVIFSSSREVVLGGAILPMQIFGVI